jgi:dipeptidyl aminopeptidase/acylaminoacyl peptidase
VPEAYRATAPLTYVKEAKTPTLIQHGERDRRAPIGGDYELLRALRDQHVPVRMIVYNNAGHAGRSFTIKQLREVMEHNLTFFCDQIGLCSERGSSPARSEISAPSRPSSRHSK